ncbi:MAG TPA: hypothetical protein VMU36_12180 [Spirochaetia bacterium]|nr:hypothetical protein [Spirochaetia bacterium]
MQKIRPLSSRTSDGGSTILEVLVALFILSSLGIGAWQAVSVSQRISARIRDAILRGSRLIRLDDQLRGLAARVLPPYWAPDEIVEIGNGTLKVAFLDGEPSKSLMVTFQKEVLVINDDAIATPYPDFRRVAFSAARDKENHPYGVTLEATQKDGSSIVITARFGGTPVTGVRSP